MCFSILYKNSALTDGTNLQFQHRSECTANLEYIMNSEAAMSIHRETLSQKKEGMEGRRERVLITHPLN